MTSARPLGLALIVSLFATPSFAQDSVTSTQTFSSFTRRLSYGVSFIQSRPQGDLSHRVRLGYGANGSIAMRLDDRGIWSLRADLGAAQYGSVSRALTIGDAAIDGLRVTLNTSSYIVPMSLGPQMTWPSGVVRPYVNAGIAAQEFFTETSVEGGQSLSSLLSSTNRSDFVSALAFGGGAYVALPIRSRTVMLDIGFQKLNGSRASYLVPSPASDDATAPRLTTVSSDTHLLVLRLGARMAW